MSRIVMTQNLLEKHRLNYHCYGYVLLKHQIVEKFCLRNIFFWARPWCQLPDMKGTKKSSRLDRQITITSEVNLQNLCLYNNFLLRRNIEIPKTFYILQRAKRTFTSFSEQTQQSKLGVKLIFLDPVCVI